MATITGPAGGHGTITLGSQNDTVILQDSNNTVTAGSGNDSITGGVDSNTVTVGSGNDTINLLGSHNTVTSGSGNDTLTLGGSSNTVTSGSGNVVVRLAGEHNTVRLGSGVDSVNGGSDSTIYLAGTNLTASGTSPMVFITTDANTEVTDNATGMTLNIGPTAGQDVLSNFAADPSGVVDLLGGIGGYTSVAGVLAALVPDGNGGTLLPLGSGSLDFANTPSLSMAGDNNSAEIYRLYETTFGRAPDAGGGAYWASVLAGGGTIAQVAQEFVQSAEFRHDYGSLSISDFVTELYQNTLNRAPDAAGLQSWTSALQAGASKASVLVGFSDSIESRTLTASPTHANWVFIPS